MAIVLKLTVGKYHLLLSGNDSSKMTIGNKTISSSKCEELLGIKIDNNLNFKKHIEFLCKRASQKNQCIVKTCIINKFWAKETYI